MMSSTMPRLTGRKALVALVAVVLVSLFFFQWLSQRDGMVLVDPARLFATSGEDHRAIEELNAKMEKVIREQSRTQELLLRLMLASPSKNESESEDEKMKKIEEILNAKKGGEGPYGPTGYKRWLAGLGQSEMELECEKRTGLTLVERFRKSEREWCTSKGRKEKSGMVCYDLPGWGSRTHTPDVICEGFDLVMDFEKIPWTPPNSFDSSGGNRHFNFQKGAFGAQCAINRSIVTGDLRQVLGNENQVDHLFWKNFVELPSDQGEIKCDVTIEHPVVIIMRHEAWNMYHQLCEWINAFVTLEVVDELDKNTQLLFLDMHESTDPYTPLLKAAFSPNHQLLLAKELVGKGKVCFKHAIMPWQGYGNFIHNNVWRASRGEPCVQSQVMEAFSHFLLNKMGLLQKPIANEPRVTLIVRKNYMGRNIDRTFANEADLIKALEEVTRGRGKLQAVQLENMGFAEQMELMYSKTNILIGAHGAGMSHLVFLPPEAIVIELLPQAWGSFTYFRNLAKLSNKIYIPILVPGSDQSLHVDIDKVRTVVDVALRIASSFNTRIN